METLVKCSWNTYSVSRVSFALQLCRLVLQLYLTLWKDGFELSGPDVGAGKAIVAFSWNQRFHFHLW